MSKDLDTLFAQFVSPTNQQAWVAAGLLVDQSTPSISCVSSTSPQSSAVGSGWGAFNISSLSTDPTTLAHELVTGKTGIPGLDQLPYDEALGDPGFTRAVALLVGPSVGGTPAFRSALLDAMATMRGVSSLGRVVTHSGQTGVGFTLRSRPDHLSVVLSRSTGALLEARNLSDPGLSGTGDDFADQADPHGFGLAGGSIHLSINWLDPVTTPTVVSVLSRAVRDNGGPDAIATEFIQAQTHPGVSARRMGTLFSTLSPLPGRPSVSYGTSGSRGVYLLRVALHGTGDETRVEAVLRQSGLFTFVRGTG